MGGSPEKSVLGKNESLGSIFFNHDSPAKNRASQIEEIYGIHSTFMLDLILYGDQIGNPAEFVASEGGKDGVIDKFRQFQNLENASPGQKEGHVVFAAYLYSNALLPLVSAIESYGQNTNDQSATNDANTAMYFLDQALDIIFHHQTHENNLVATFTRMKAEALKGNSSYQDFLTLMNMAKIASIECVQKHGNKDIRLDPNVPVPDKVSRGNFNALRHLALAEYESEQGTKFPQDLGEKIRRSKALVVSLDWNSTWNQAESYANGDLVAATTNLLRQLKESFNTVFPDKQLYFVLNTGRPAKYAWGIIETLATIDAMRSFGLVESGGAILKEGMKEGEIAVALDYIKDGFAPRPEEWKEILNGEILVSLQTQVMPPDKLFNEEKESSLAIRVQDKKTGAWIYKDRNGQPITDETIKQGVENYLKGTIKSIERQVKEVMAKMTLSVESSDFVARIESIINLGPDGISGTINDMDDARLAQLETALEQMRSGHSDEIIKLTRKLRLIKYVQAKLAVKLNPTAGFVDIVHGDLNKYSTLRMVMAEKGIREGAFVMIHVGDSDSDNMPEQQTGPGQVNAGADEVYLVGVGNTSEGYRKSIEKRQPRDRGILIPRDTILGLMDMIGGLNKLVTGLKN